MAISQSTDAASPIQELAGKKFGRWTVLSEIQKEKGQRHKLLCRCDCGTERICLRHQVVNLATTAEQLTGRHVCIGVMKAHRLCCDGAGN